MEQLAILASAITSLTVIITGFSKVYKFIRKTEEKYEQIDKKFDMINKTMKVNTIHLLKIAVLDENLPLTDRIHAGEEYIALGGNGFIKKKYEKLLEEYEQKYKS